MIKTFITNLVTARNYMIYKKFDFLSKINEKKFRVDSNANFVVSIATYPKRSHLLPAVFEALNKQTVKPKKWILVISEEEWPNLILPQFLTKLQLRGLEIIWVKNNNYAVKKLVPVIEKYPDLGVITLDDDIIYEPNLVGNLVDNFRAKEGSIVGHVGKTMVRKNSELQMMFRDNTITNSKTNPVQVFLIGWGGIYYPSNSLSKKVTDIRAIQKIVPGRGSDIWFWAAALANNTNQYCIEAYNNKNLGIPIPTTNNTKPKDTPSANQLEDRFQKAIDFFEIREKLLVTLPNKN